MDKRIKLAIGINFSLALLVGALCLINLWASPHQESGILKLYSHYLSTGENAVRLTGAYSAAYFELRPQDERQIIQPSPVWAKGFNVARYEVPSQTLPITLNPNTWLVTAFGSGETVFLDIQGLVIVRDDEREVATKYVVGLIAYAIAVVLFSFGALAVGKLARKGLTKLNQSK